MIADLALTSIETISAFDVSTGAYKWTLDELQNATVAQTQDMQEVTGKGGRILNRLKRNKAVTISATNGLISGGLLESQTGGEFETKTTKVMWTDYLTVNASHEATTTWKAVGTTGAEINALYVRERNGALGAELEQASTVAAGKFTYTPNTKQLVFHSDIVEGTEVVVFYERQISADVLVNESDKYSGKATLYIDCLAEDNCANVYRVQIYVPKADFSGEFSLEFGGDQAVHSFEANSLAGGCGNGNYYWTYTVFGVNTADEA